VLRAFLAEADGKNPRRTERVVPWPATPDEAASVGREAGKSLLVP